MKNIKPRIIDYIFMGLAVLCFLFTVIYGSVKLPSLPDLLQMLQAVVCDDERAGIYAHRAQYGKNNQDPSPLIDDRARHTCHQLVFVHISIPFPLREKRRIGLTQLYIIIRLCPVSKN